MPVQSERGLELLDRLPHGGRADRLGRVARVLQPHVLGELRRVVQPGAVRGAVEAEDRPLARRGHLCDHGRDPRREVGLVLLAIGVPRRPVRPTRGGELEAVEIDDAPFAEGDVLRLADDVVHFQLIIVSRADDTGDPRARQALVGQVHPLLDRLEHLLLEQPVPVRLVLVQGLHRFGVAPERVVAASDHRLLELAHLILAHELLAVFEQGRVPVLAAVVDDGDERLAGHVAAEDERVRLVVGAGVEELPPAGLRSVDVRGEEDAHGAI